MSKSENSTEYDLNYKYFHRETMVHSSSVIEDFEIEDRSYFASWVLHNCETMGVKSSIVVKTNQSFLVTKVSKSTLFLYAFMYLFSWMFMLMFSGGSADSLPMFQNDVMKFLYPTTLISFFPILSFILTTIQHNMMVDFFNKKQS